VIEDCEPGAVATLPPNWFFRCFVTPMPVSVTDPEEIKTNLVSDFVTRNVLSRTQIPKPGSPRAG
jgi:hypothetical protein